MFNVVRLQPVCLKGQSGGLQVRAGAGAWASWRSWVCAAPAAVMNSMYTSRRRP